MRAANVAMIVPRWWVTIVLFWVSLLLAACQGGAPLWLTPWRNADEAPPAAVGNERGRDLPELHILGPAVAPAADAQFLALVEAFNQAETDVTANLTLTPDYDDALQAALALATPPDLFVLDSGRARDLALAGVLAPFDQTLFNTQDVYPQLHAAFSLDGALYCLPREVRTLALLYDRDRFDEAGLSYPDETWAWDDLRAAAEALTDRETATFGLALPPDFSRWLPFLYQAGGAVTDDDFSVMAINSDEARAAMDFYVRLVFDGHAAAPAELESAWAGEALAQRRAAMVIEGNWALPYLRRVDPPLNFGVAELPAGPHGRATVAFATCYAMAAGSPHHIPAQRLAQQLSQAEILWRTPEIEGAYLPPQPSLAAEWRQQHPDQAPFLAGLATAQLWQFGPRFNPLLQMVNAGLQQGFLGVRSVADILAQADGVGNRALGR